MSTFKDLETAAQAKIKTEEKAVKAWFGTNWIPFALGLVCGILTMVMVHRL